MRVLKLNYQKLSNDDQFHSKDKSVIIKKEELLVGTLNTGNFNLAKGSLIGVI